MIRRDTRTQFLSIADQIEFIFGEVFLLGGGRNGQRKRRQERSARLTFARWRILFSEESFQQIVADIGGFLFGFSTGSR